MSRNSSLIPHMKQKRSHQNATTNGKVIPLIPFDVIEQILLNLDAQTLLKCTLICRDWNSLITSSNFISRNSDRAFDYKNQVILIDTYISQQNSYSLYWDNDEFDLFRRVESPPTFDGFNNINVMVGTSNGLVCLTDPLHENFTLWNPTIRKYVMLSTWDDEDRIEDDDGKHSYVGFGFDSRSNDFKVVELVKDDYDELDMVWVFSYITWSWKCLKSLPSPCKLPHYERTTMFMNGILHLIARHREGYDFILTLDVAREVFGEILLPKSIARSMDWICIVPTEDSSLAVVHYDNGGLERHWSVWVMKQYGVHDSWTNIVNLQEDHFYDKTGKVLIPRDVLIIKKNQDMILQLTGGLIVRYNPTTRTMNILQGLGVRGYIDFIHYYTMNLYLLEKGDHVNSY